MDLIKRAGDVMPPLEPIIDASFRALAQAVPVLVWSARADGSLDFYNAAWRERVAQSEGPNGDDWTATVDPSQMPQLRALRDAANLDGTPYELTLRLKERDGTYRAQRVQAFPEVAPGGSVVRWHHVALELADEGLQPPLSGSEAHRARDVAYHTPGLLFTQDAQGHVTFVNERWISVIGCMKSELLGNGWYAFMHADDRERVRLQWPAHASSGEPYKSQWRLRRVDGTYRWIEIRAEAQRSADGSIGRWYGVGVDIDEQRRALDALEFLVESGASIAGEQDIMKMLGSLAQASLAGVADISIFDLLDEGDGMRLVVAAPEVSPEAVALVRAYGPPDSASDHPIAQAIARRESIVVSSVDDRYTAAHVADDERRRTWHTVAIHSFLSVPIIISGKAIGALTLLRTLTGTPFQSSDIRILEDIARRAAVAIENVRLNVAARRESLDRLEQFRRIADLSPQFMWTADASGRIDWWNKRWYEFSGQSEKEALGFGSGALLHPSDRQAVTARWAHALATGEPFDAEYRVCGADGAYRWFLGRAVAERDLSSAVVKWYGSTADIHESRRAARTMSVFADLGEALSETLGLDATLNAILDIVVPAYADWAYISLVDTAGELRIAAAVHTEIDKQKALDTVLGKALAGSDARIGSPQVLRSRTPMLVRESDYAEARSYLRADVIDIFESVGFSSVLICPLLVGTVSRGTLVLCMSERTRLFDPDDVPFFQELARRIAPAISNAELYERERRVAKLFQQAALPAELPACRGFQFDAIYEAGLAEALVGGDWYDAFVLLDGRIVLSIGDVAGSGLEAAVIMASVRQAIRGVAQVHADPDLMLEAADRALRSENPDRFVTAFVGVIDPVERTIAYQSAGHPPPLLLRGESECVELRSSGLPLGLRSDDEPSTQSASLGEDSLLVLYTDGLIESTHDLAEGERRLRSAAATVSVTSADRPAKSIHDIVLTEGSRDDVAILTVRIGALAEPQRWVTDTRDDVATGDVRRSVVEAMQSGGLSERALVAAELILAELVANIARYTPGGAELLLEWNGTSPVLHALDRGPGFEFAAKLPQDIYSESGRGLFLITKLSHDFSVARRSGGGSHARVVLKT
ncbi:MAG: SpoIIE family protein phosphatase [Candidatus Eremiobacteraeota bacterium]|nr:SpoIIE family protein phosphatase [Candidatus Eremiobacteraeota bacterium]